MLLHITIVRASIKVSDGWCGNLSLVAGLSTNSDNLFKQYLVLIVVYMAMASKEKMLHLSDSIMLRNILVRVKESLKYEGIALAIGCSIRFTQTPKLRGVEK